MENPSTWGPIQRLIDETITEYEKDLDACYCGYSLATTLYFALKNAGLLNETIKPD